MAHDGYQATKALLELRRRFLIDQTISLARFIGYVVLRTGRITRAPFVPTSPLDRDWGRRQRLADHLAEIREQGVESKDPSM